MYSADGMEREERESESWMVGSLKVDRHKHNHKAGVAKQSRTYRWKP